MVDDGIQWARDNGQLWTDGDLNKPSAGKRGEVHPIQAEHGPAFRDGARMWFSLALYQDPHIWKFIPRSVPSQSF